MTFGLQQKPQCQSFLLKKRRNNQSRPRLIQGSASAINGIINVMERTSIQRTQNDGDSGLNQETLWLVKPTERAIDAFERRQVEIIAQEAPDPRIHHCIGSLVIMPT